MLEGLSARSTHDSAQWVLGDLAAQVETTYGENTLAKYAEDVGCDYNTLRRCRYLSTAYEFVHRCTNLTWTHHLSVASRDDRLEWLTRAVEGGWSVRQMLEAIQETERVAAAATINAATAAVLDQQGEDN